MSRRPERSEGVNVLFLTTHLNAGGITSYLLTLAKGMTRRGAAVHIASSGGDMAQEFASCAVRLCPVNIRTKSEIDPKVYLALGPLYGYIRQNHIGIIHSNTRITQVMGSLLGRMTGCSHVSTCHGFFKTRWFRKLFPCWGEAVIAISEAVEDHLVKDFGIPPKRVVLIKSGVDVESFHPVDEKTKAGNRGSYGFGPEPLVGIIARLSDVKGQDILIAAMKKVVERIPEARLLIAGAGKTEMTLKNITKSLRLEDSVVFLPMVDKTQEILSLLDVFVMPSRQEGLGLSIMEAQAAGLPVVASNVGGIPSLIEHGKTGILVETGNSQVLAEAIISLLQDKNKMRQLGAAARDFIQQNHCAEVMVDKTLKFYEELTGVPPR